MLGIAGCEMITCKSYAANHLPAPFSRHHDWLSLRRACEVVCYSFVVPSRASRREARRICDTTATLLNPPPTVRASKHAATTPNRARIIRILPSLQAVAHMAKHRTPLRWVCTARNRSSPAARPDQQSRARIKAIDVPGTLFPFHRSAS
jgi:hypothetical protein